MLSAFRYPSWKTKSREGIDLIKSLLTNTANIAGLRNTYAEAAFSVNIAIGGLCNTYIDIWLISPLSEQHYQPS